MGEGPTAALLQQIFDVDPLACPSSHGAMRIVAFSTQGSVIDQILAHLRARATTRRGLPDSLGLTPPPRSRGGTFG